MNTFCDGLILGKTFVHVVLIGFDRIDDIKIQRGKLKENRLRSLCLYLYRYFLRASTAQRR